MSLDRRLRALEGFRTASPADEDRQLSGDALNAELASLAADAAAREGISVDEVLGPLIARLEAEFEAGQSESDRR